MRLTVLGGYTALTSTGAGCSGYLVRDGGTSVVADLGPGTLAQLRRQIDVRSLDAIVISHGHLDHILDLGALHHVLRYSPTPLERKIPLYLPPGSSWQFDLWERALYGGPDGRMLDETFVVTEYDPDVELEIGAIKVRLAPTIHPLPAWAMRFSSHAGRAIGYTADTGPSAALDDFFAGVDVLVAEATLIDPDEAYDTRGHLTAGEAAGFAQRAGASTLVLTHRWEESDADAQVIEARLAFGGRVELSAPGLTIGLAEQAS